MGCEVLSSAEFCGYNGLNSRQLAMVCVCIPKATSDNVELAVSTQEADEQTQAHQGPKAKPLSKVK